MKENEGEKINSRGTVSELFQSRSVAAENESFGASSGRFLFQSSSRKDPDHFLFVLILFFSFPDQLQCNYGAVLRAVLAQIQKQFQNNSKEN